MTLHLLSNNRTGLRVLSSFPILVILAHLLTQSLGSPNIRCGDRAVSSVRYNASTSKARIYGGRFAEPGELPFQVKLFMNGLRNTTGCGGVIIGPRTILTAAHCLVARKNICKKLGKTIKFRPHQIEVWIGDLDFGIEDGEQRIDVLDTLVHPNYCPYNNQPGFFYDIAIIKTRERINFQLNEDGYGSVNRICLPRQGQTYVTGLPVVSSGWGRTEHGYQKKLKLVNLELLDRCSYKTHGRICTSTLGGRGICLGDSGGPVFRYREESGQAELVGVSSFVISPKCVNTKECTESVYTRIADYMDWIEQFSNIDYDYWWIR